MVDRPTAPEQRDIEIVPPPVIAGRLGGEPVGGRLELELREIDGAPADVLVRQELQLEEGHEAGDHDLPWIRRPPMAGASANTSSGLRVTARLA